MSDTTQFEIVRLAADRHSSVDSARLLPRSHQRLLMGLCVVIAATAALLCLQQPQLQPAWAGAALFLPAVLFGLRFSTALARAPRTARLSLARSLVGVGCIVLLPLMARLAEGFGWLDIELARRAIGALLGAALMVTGSVTPRRLLPFAAQRFDAALALKLVRFVGLGLVLAGVCYGLIWLSVPLAAANLWASATAATFAVLIAARSVFMVITQGR